MGRSRTVRHLEEVTSDSVDETPGTSTKPVPRPLHWTDRRCRVVSSRPGATEDPPCEDIVLPMAAIIRIFTNWFASRCFMMMCLTHTNKLNSVAQQPMRYSAHLSGRDHQALSCMSRCPNQVVCLKG
ncbi:hypothetical protein TNCV_3314511 [Trichonephila clavipes]|nr:hypothetical protein TNCV_3314511 [Trichonephila clavipes]